MNNTGEKNHHRTRIVLTFIAAGRSLGTIGLTQSKGEVNVTIQIKVQPKTAKANFIFCRGKYYKIRGFSR